MSLALRKTRSFNDPPPYSPVGGWWWWLTWLIQCHLNSQYNGDNYKMLIKIFHSSLNRSINIIEDGYYYRSTSHLVFFWKKNNIFIILVWGVFTPFLDHGNSIKKLAQHIHLQMSLLESFVVGKLFSQVRTHQGLILAFVYPWYTNSEQNRRKDHKLNYASGIARIECTNCSMNKEYKMEKKALFDEFR